MIAVTAVWGVTFVRVRDALELYPLFAFLAIRFAIATLTLAPVGASRLAGAGWPAGLLLGLLLALGYALHTAGPERTTVMKRNDAADRARCDCEPIGDARGSFARGSCTGWDRTYGPR